MSSNQNHSVKNDVKVVTVQAQNAATNVYTIGAATDVVHKGPIGSLLVVQNTNGAAKNFKINGGTDVSIAANSHRILVKTGATTLALTA